jgi:DNA-binding MurR/RpiR family transcriptional regulator
MAALQDLLEVISEKTLADTAKLLVRAETIYIAGQLRSEPIASLLRYLLTMLRRRIVLLDPAGGLAQEMATTMTDRDVLIAIAFRHYAKEVIVISDVAVTNGTSIVAITDSQLSPLAKDAKTLFTIPEDEYLFSRSLAAPMCLVQCIAMATAALLQPGRNSTPRIPTVTEMAQHRTAAQARRQRHASKQ